jgi:hypothetical protein
MFNDRLSDEVAKERIDQRMKEAETCSRQKSLGFSESGAARWIFPLVVLIAALIWAF